MSDSENDIPQLSSDTLKALQEFYDQQAEKEERLQSVLQSTDEDGVASFEENWQLSQFWYDDTTAEVLAREALRVSGPEGRIALISCPTLYVSLRKQVHNCHVTLFEYDHRFSVYGSDFMLYDYKSPLDLPRDLSGSYDLVIADPPFLSEECLTKMAVTMKFLAKDKMVLCTGTTMQHLAQRLLELHQTSFQPTHRNNLANQFSCYCNYDMDHFIK